MSESILERLQAQRSLLVDVVRQLDTAIALFGGAASTNGHQPADGRREHWTKRASPAQLAAWNRKVQHTRRRNKRAKRVAAFKAEAEAAARQRETQPFA